MIAWKSIYGSLPRGVAGRTADPLVGSAARRHPLVGAQRSLQLVADPLPRRDRARALCVARPWIGLPALLPIAVDDLLQRLDPGLVGQRRLRRTPLRRHDPAVRARASRHSSSRRRRRPAASASNRRQSGGALLVALEPDADERRAGRPRPDRRSRSFGEAGAHQARAFHRWFGNPFTYPVSLCSRCATICRSAPTTCCRRNASSGDQLRPYGRIDVGSDDELWLRGRLARRGRRWRSLSAGRSPPPRC